MSRFMSRLIGVFLLYNLLKWVINLPGNPGTKPPRSDKVPWGVDALNDEFGRKLPESVYQVFSDGFRNQTSGNLMSAWRNYKMLKRIPRADNSTLDLTKISKVIQHNTKLLKTEVRKRMPDKWDLFGFDK